MHISVTVQITGDSADTGEIRAWMEQAFGEAPSPKPPSEEEWPQKQVVKYLSMVSDKARAVLALVMKEQRVHSNTVQQTLNVGGRGLGGVMSSLGRNAIKLGVANPVGWEGRRGEYFHAVSAEARHRFLAELG